jgi:uncharacterized membrane protein
VKPDPGLFGGSPADALAGIARQLNLSIDRNALTDRFRLHPHSRSLLALVEIAPEIGLVVRAFQTDSTGLTGTSLPAVVQLRDASDRDSFALLIERRDREVVLEDPVTLQRHRLAPLAFEALWTGIVATAVPREGGAARARPTRVADRARVWLRSGFSTGLAVAGWTAVVLAASAALFTAGAHGTSAVRAVILVLFDLVGAAVSVVLLQASRRSGVASAAPRLSSVLCRRGTLTDCESVLSSRFARIGGIELAVLGFGFFVSSVLLATAGVVADIGFKAQLFAWLAACHLAAVPVSLWLIGVQLWPLRRLCLLCMIVHAAVIASAVVGATLVHGLTLQDIAPLVFLHANFFLAAIGTLVPLFDLRLEAKVSRTWLGWASATPWGALAAVAGQPAVALVDPGPGVPFGKGDGPFQVDAFVHPLCPVCPPLMEGLQEIDIRHREHVQVRMHLPPRDPRSDADRELCVALTAVGILAGPEQTIFVFGAVKKDTHRWLRLAEGGAERVLEQLLRKEDVTPETLARARSAVAAADRTNAATRRGVPSLLLNGRQWDAPLSDLDALLTRHRDALGAALGLRPAGRDATASRVVESS